jgi:hypothetical protein
VGVTFPITITEGAWKPIEGDLALIRENIRSLILHPKGFRIRQEDYGTRIEEFIEEPDTQLVSNLVKMYIRSAISTYEPRVIINKITTQRNQGKLGVTLEYSISNTPLSDYLDIEYDLTELQ